MVPPDRITIFMYPMVHYHRKPEAIRQQVRRTVLHEIGHHFGMDEEQLRPYFKLDNVREGAFAVANKLYGITFEERTDLPKYHEDVKVFEVKDADGSHLGIYTADYFPRESKQGGAWMNSFRKQSRLDGDVTPIICNVCNFSVFLCYNMF